MKRILACLACAIPLAALAADEKPAANPQQAKMAACNQDASARQLKGDERKAFMSGCLSADGPGPQNAQQRRMGRCNQDASARQLKGDERKAFMSQCLKG